MTLAFVRFAVQEEHRWGWPELFKAVRLRGGEEDGLVYPLLKMCKTLNRSQARVARLGLNMIQTFQARGAGFQNLFIWIHGSPGMVRVL